MTKDPVCDLNVDDSKSALFSNFGGKSYFFCSESCKKAFDSDPAKYITPKIKIDKSPLLFGFIGSSILLIVYFLVVSLTNLTTPQNIIPSFTGIWYWILILVTGFGVQVGLYTFIKKAKHHNRSLTTGVAVSGTLSTGSMVACCAHNIVTLLPLLGLSAFALFVVQYQLPIILAGVFSNLIGITIMLSMIKKHNLTQKQSFLKLIKLPWRYIRIATIVLGISIILFSFFSVNLSAQTTSVTQTEVKEIKLKEQTNNQSMVTVKVQPQYAPGSDIIFTISFSTHVVELDFDVIKISSLTDSNGKQYVAVAWKGDPPGGHHRRGRLMYPPVEGTPESITLTLEGVGKGDVRSFTWKLK